MMDHDQLQFDLRQAASVRMLKSPHAPLMVSFLYRAFKSEQHAALPYAALLDRLETALETLTERHPGLYPLGAAAYLKQWSDDEHQLIRIIVRGSDDATTVELTAEAERALGWVEDLYRREFVGTESRFLSIFQLLEEIAVRSTDSRVVELGFLRRLANEARYEVRPVIKARIGSEILAEVLARLEQYAATDA